MMALEGGHGPKKEDQFRYTMPFLRLMRRDIGESTTKLREVRLSSERKEDVKKVLDALKKESNALMKRFNKIPVFMEGNFDQFYTLVLMLHRRALHHSSPDYADQYDTTARDRELFYEIECLAGAMERRIIKLGELHDIDIKEIIRPGDNPRLRNSF